MLLEESLIMDFEKRLMTKSSSSTRETIQKMMKHHENHEQMWNALPNQTHLIQLISLSVDAPVIYNGYVRYRDTLNVIRFGKHKRKPSHQLNNQTKLWHQINSGPCKKI